MKNWLAPMIALSCLLAACGNDEPEVAPLTPPAEERPLTAQQDPKTPKEEAPAQEGEEEPAPEVTVDPAPELEQTPGVVGEAPVVEETEEPQRACSLESQPGDLCADSNLLFVGNWQSLFMKNYQLITTPTACDYEGHCFAETNELMLTWKNAQSYCEDLSWGGFEDWALPSIDELTLMYCRSGVEYQSGWSFWNWFTSEDESNLEDPICADYGGRSAVLEGLQRDFYWSGEQGEETDSSRAWRVEFEDGLAYEHLHSHRSHVRCVRREPISL